MNKAESKLCRKLMAHIGLTEAEVREHKKYRKMLSEAQTAGEKGLNFVVKARRDTMKIVTKSLKLPKEHPLVIEAYKKIWLERRHGWSNTLAYYYSPF